MKKFGRLRAWGNSHRLGGLGFLIGLECLAMAGLAWVLIPIGRRGELPTYDEFLGLLFFLGPSIFWGACIWGLAIQRPGRRSELLMAILAYLGAGLVVATHILALISSDG